MACPPGGMSPHPHSPTRPHFCCCSQPLPDCSQSTLQGFSHRHHLPRGSGHPGRVPDRLRRCNSKWQQWLIPPSSVDRGSVPEGHPGGSGSTPSHTWWPALGVGGPCVCGTSGDSMAPPARELPRGLWPRPGGTFTHRHLGSWPRSDMPETRTGPRQQPHVRVPQWGDCTVNTESCTGGRHPNFGAVLIHLGGRTGDEATLSPQ